MLTIIINHYLALRKAQEVVCAGPLMRTLPHVRNLLPPHLEVHITPPSTPLNVKRLRCFPDTVP